MNSPEILAGTLIFAGVLYSVVLHEGAHALTALWCGDDTAKRMGRVTLNPLPSIDPIGTLLLPALAAFYSFPCIAWAVPVSVNPDRFRHRVWGDVIVSMAGIVVNLLLAFLFFCFWHQQSKTSPDTLKAHVLLGIAGLNVQLALFNLIPFPPLDGHHVCKYLLPPEWRDGYQRIGFWGIVVIFVALQIPEVSEWYRELFCNVAALVSQCASAVIDSF